MNTIIEIICWIGRHKFLMLGIAIPLLVVSIIIKALKKKRIKWIIFFTILIMWYAIINIIWGDNISNSLIYKYGETGKGVVIQIKSTNSSYNKRTVMAYEVILTTKDNKTIETEFESWDFNIYPKPEGGYSYPQTGIEFSVKYLKNNPNLFIIIGNDNSPYAIEKECQKIRQEFGTAKLKYEAAPTNPNYKKEYIDATKKYLTCEKNEFLLDYFKKEIEKLENQK